MQQKKLVKVVELPKFEDIKGKEVGEAICNLFRHLIPDGMERPVDVDPRKIRLNYEDCKELIGNIQQAVNDNEELKVNLLWLNQGPAGDKDVPEGKIYLYEGYMKPANHEKNTNKKVG